MRLRTSSRCAADLKRLREYAAGAHVVHPPLRGRSCGRDAPATEATQCIGKLIEVLKDDPCHGRSLNGYIVRTMVASLRKTLRKA